MCWHGFLEVNFCFSDIRGGKEDNFTGTAAEGQTMT